MESQKPLGGRVHIIADLGLWLSMLGSPTSVTLVGATHLPRGDIVDAPGLSHLHAFGVYSLGENLVPDIRNSDEIK
uniref:Uncharacterized protein n=1 Tax=Oryza barthii TaxID=65489 RepID=A0A0D3G4A0_9ORYZ